PLARAGDPLEELHVQLQPVAGHWLLIALPALPMRLVLLVRWEPMHAESVQDAMDGRASDRDAVEPPQIVRDLAGPKVVGLPQVQNLAHDCGRRRLRRTVGPSRPIVQAGRAEFRKTPFPFVKSLP